MRIYATKQEGDHEMTLYARWFSTDGKYAMQEGGEIIDLEKEGFELKTDPNHKLED